MNIINSILKDESLNDKELIKELSVYIKNHINKKKPINKQLVIDLTNIVARNSELYFEKVKFVNDTQFNAYWDYYKMHINFNMTLTLTYAKLMKYSYHQICDKNIFIYYYILITIIHELTHARQYYLINMEKNQIYSSCNELLNKKYDVYFDNYDVVLMERYAGLRAETLTYEVLSYIYPTNKIQELKHQLFTDLLLGYKANQNQKLVQLVYEKELPVDFEIISIIDNYNMIMEENSLPKVNIPFFKDMTLYERLYLGLPVSTKEYRELISLYEDIHYKPQKEKVKELINKL